MVKKASGKRELNYLEWEMNDSATGASRSDVHRRIVKEKNTVDP